MAIGRRPSSSPTTPSPALDPRLPDSKRALIGFNPQTPHRELTPEHVADEPGHAPIQFTAKLVQKAAAQLRDLRAPGTLPQDNRIIKAIIRQPRGLKAVTEWANAVAADQGGATARDLSSPVASALPSPPKSAL